MCLPYQPPEPLNCAAIRELDRTTIETIGLPGLALMENAGRRCAEEIHTRLTQLGAAPGPVVVLCGPGNNGGDGFVIARHLHNAGYAVRVVLAVPPEKFRGDARTNLDVVAQLALPLYDASDTGSEAEPLAGMLAEASVVVDALLGTGATGAPRGRIAELIEQANTVPAPLKVAIDVPSGLDADRGRPATPCFQATLTVTLLAAKVGFAQAAAAAVLGEVVVADIGVPRDLLAGSRD